MTLECGIGLLAADGHIPARWSTGGTGASMADAEGRADPLGPENPAVVAFLGPALEAIAAFADLLVDEGITRGLIGPREVPRLWDRHLLNSAAVASLLPASATVLDIGSGAGLPGVVLAAMRPDLTVVLVEPMERRTVWLQHVVESLGLASVEVVRGRAEELVGRWSADVVTARAVAPLDRLVPWTLPLLRHHGVLLAMKGDRAQAEVEAAREVIARYGGGDVDVLDVPSVPGCSATVVRIRRTSMGGVAPPSRLSRSSSSRATRR